MIRFGVMISVRAIMTGSAAALAIIGCSFEKTADSAVSPEEPLANGPLSATYRIEDVDIQLSNGYFERPAAPGSAAKITVAVFDAPVYGDLDRDGDSDAAVILVYQAGGSGTFYYMAATVDQAGRYYGTNAIFLGDRIIPQALAIRSETIVADYADREPGEAMAATPTFRVAAYAFLDGQELVAVPAAKEESGWVTVGHEVRSFRPCEGNIEHWVLGRSPAISDLQKTYRDMMANARPYTPLFMVLSGGFLGPPDDGFGKDYAGAFFATELIDADPARHCREEFIAIKAPAPGTVIDSPLEIRGRARGTWFFEGDFPVVLENANGNVVANGFVTAQGEWMTTEFVPFEGILSFNRPAQAEPGLLIFKKDNPSDRRELDDEMSIPIFFQE